jgi:hypothetical protein
MSFWTDLKTSVGDVMPTFAPGSLEYALTEYAGVPSEVLAPVVQMIRDAAPNVPADFDYTQAVQNMVAKQNAQFGGFTQNDFSDGQLPAKLFEQLPGGATAMQNLRQLPSFQNAQALGAERQQQAEQSGDSFLGGIARPFLDTASGLNEMRKEGALNPILAFAGPAVMPSIMSSFGGAESGLAMGNFDPMGPVLTQPGAGAGAAGSSFGGTAGGFGGGGSDGLASLATGNFDPMGAALTQPAAGGMGGATSGLIQQLANYTGLSTSAIERLGGAAISSLAGLAGAGMTSSAAREAANRLAGANQTAMQLQSKMYEDQVARQQPFYQAGVNALPAYTKGVMPGGDLVKPFSMADYQADPGYGFRMSEGMKALDRSAASRGGLLSGATMKGAQRYGQDLASQEYQNAYNRYTGNQATQRNALAGLTGFAPTAAQQIGAAGTNYANTAGNLGINTATNYGNAELTGAAARQSAYGGAGGAFANALSPNPLSAYLNKQYGGMV